MHINRLLIALFITFPGDLLPTELYLLLILQNIYLVNVNILPTLLATKLMRKKHTPVREKYYSVFGKPKGA